MPTRPIHEVLAGRPFLAVGADVSVREVTRLMQAQDRSSALVTEHGVLTGIFTERDATFRVLAAGLDPDATAVGQVMTHKPYTLSDDQPFGYALHLMYESCVRHVPVVDGNNRPLGVLTARDALGVEAEAFGSDLERRQAITAIL